MIQITPRGVAHIGTCDLDLASRHCGGLNMAMRQYGVVTPLQQAHFLAQVAHESGGFRYSEEIWGPTGAQRRYEGRSDLGNTEEGDGYRFRGRGLIQLTGRSNYEQYAKHLRFMYGDRVPDVLRHPGELAHEPLAADVAGWFWRSRHLNGLAQRDMTREVTLAINGGLNGFSDRLERLALAKEILMDRLKDRYMAPVEVLAPEKLGARSPFSPAFPEG